MPKDELTLNDGTPIILKTLYQSQTYEGLLEGLPNAEFKRKALRLLSGLSEESRQVKGHRV